MLDRFGAIAWMAEHSRNIIDAKWAESLAVSVGVPFHELLRLDPKMIRTPAGDFTRDEKRRDGWFVGGAHMQQDLVQVSDLASAMARYMGLYFNVDHSRQSPHATKGKEAQYIAQRACVKMCDHFRPDGSWRRDLLQEVPGIMQSGVGAFPRDPKSGGKIIGKGGVPLVVGRDAILREKLFKP